MHRLLEIMATGARLMAALLLAVGMLAPAWISAPAAAQGQPGTQAAADGPGPSVAEIERMSPDQMMAEIQRAMQRLFPADLDGVKPIWEGQPELEGQGDFLTLTLPALSFAMPEGGRFIVGRARMNLRPLDQEHVQFNLVVPSRMPLLDGAGQEIGAIRFDGQQFGGVWLPRYLQVVQVQAAYSDISVDLPVAANPLPPGAGTMSGPPRDFRVERLEWVRDFAPADDGTYGGDERMTATGLRLSDGMGTDMALARMNVTNRVRGFDLEAASSLTEILQMLGTIQATRLARGPGDGMPETDDQADATLARLRGLDPVIGSIESRATLSGLRMRNAQGQGFELDEMIHMANIEGMDDLKSSVELGLRINGGRTIPEPTGPDFAPNDASIRISITRVPNRELWQALQTMIDNAELLPIELAASQMMSSIPRLLSNSGTRIELHTGQYRSDALEFDLTGDLVFDPDAALGALFQTRLVVQGLNTLIAQVPGDDPRQAMLLPVVAMLRSLAQVSMDEQGREMLTIQLQSDAEGTVLLNGADISERVGPLMDMQRQMQQR